MPGQHRREECHQDDDKRRIEQFAWLRLLIESVIELLKMT